MGSAFKAFYNVLVGLFVSFGGTLVYGTLLIFISRIVDDLKLEILFKRVSPLTKLLATMFLAGIFITPFNLIYNKLHVIISSEGAPLLRFGQMAEGIVLIFIVYTIYKSFKSSSEDRV